MSQCKAVLDAASTGVAPALRAVDCMSAEVTSAAFTNLFGSNGALAPVLTLLLTLYIALFAIALLTGRSKIGISTLTPRMVTLGVVLTFATSWAAYQSVVWNLAVGAPDQIASALLGVRGSATQLFADKIDILFNVITETAQTVGGPGARPTLQGAFTPVNLMWLAGMFLMLGTVGILVTARIALAVLLAVGPVFVTFILFNGTRGLFAGWLRGVILTAITPLFAVLGGGLMIELATPIVVALRASEVLDPRAAMALLIFSIVHCALMALAIRVASAMVSGWQVFGMANASSGEPGGAQRADQSALAANSPYGASTASALSRSQSLTASVIAANAVGGSGAAASSTTATTRNIVNTITGTGSAIGSGAPARSRGIGSRFASRPPVSREFLR